MCGGSILSCCPRNPHGHERALKEEEINIIFSPTCVGHVIVHLPCDGGMIILTTYSGTCNSNIFLSFKLHKC